MFKFEQIRQTRKTRGLSQQQVASMAGISMATLQNIEAGRANPELATLDSLLNALGLQLEIAPAQIAWEPLVHLGLPLLLESYGGPRKRKPPTRRELLSQLQNLAPQLQLIAHGSREEDAFTSFLLALRDHYSSLWNLLDPKLRDWLSKKELSGRHIKLRRMALERLAEYL